MISKGDYQYAFENTEVVLPLRRRIESFHTTIVHYYLVTEDMDVSNLVRVREGRVEADRPKILSPQKFSKLFLEGFGDKAESFVEKNSLDLSQVAFLKYGFFFRKADIRCYEAHEPLVAVVEKLKKKIEEKGDMMSGVIVGVDDAWEVSLLKFLMDTIQGSSGGNMKDFIERGLI